MVKIVSSYDAGGTQLTVLNSRLIAQASSLERSCQVSSPIAGLLQGPLVPCKKM